MEASETEVLKEGKINREKENLGFPKTSSDIDSQWGRKANFRLTCPMRTIMI